ncbi:MAG: hypothetical protein AAFR87_27965 [Bacteroidota bacterium]
MLNKLRHINKVRILPEYFLFVFLFLASFNLNGTLAESPLSHAEIAYIEWVAHAQEVEQEEELNTAEKTAVKRLQDEGTFSEVKIEFLLSLLIQQDLTLISLKRQNQITDLFYPFHQISGASSSILYPAEEDPYISIS